MYFPYLRGRRFDYLAIREANQSIFTSGKVLPIIEPIVLDRKTLKDLSVKKISSILITNPRCGKLSQKDIVTAVGTHLSSHPSLTIGINIDIQTSAREVRSLLHNYPKHRKAIVFHGENDAPALRRLLEESRDEIDWIIFIDGMISDVFFDSYNHFSRVLVTDSFKKLIRNADYPAKSHYSSLPANYHTEGLAGFGDFLTMPYHYSESGGPAHAVAIHLTSETAGHVTCHHFVSDDTLGLTNVAGKYEQARLKALAFLNAHPQINVTTGAKMLQGLGFPGLGVVKKMSMIHHMEMMSKLV